MDKAYDLGWLAAMSATLSVLDHLMAEGLVKGESEVLKAFRSGQEATLIVAAHKISELRPHPNGGAA